MSFADDIQNKLQSGCNKSNTNKGSISYAAGSYSNSADSKNYDCLAIRRKEMKVGHSTMQNQNQTRQSSSDSNGL